MGILKTVFSSGAVANFFLVLLGGFIGLLFKKGIPEKISNTLMKGMALCVFYIGVTGLFEDGLNIIVIILSFGLGGVIGELIDLDRLVNLAAKKLEDRVNKKGGNTKIAQGFVTATLLFCVGAMTVVGSIDSGISGDNATLYSKSVIDCISGAVLASTMGLGIMLAAFPVIIIEGGLTLLAVFFQPLLTAQLISYMSVIGSALIVALSFNMLKITNIKVMNLLPAIFMPLILTLFI